MSNANAEAQRRWRQRQKERRKEALREADSQHDVFKAPFFKFFGFDQRVGSDFDISLILAGFETPKFDDDSGAFANTAYPDPETLTEDNPIFEAKDSLGRAEFILGSLAHAAQDLAGWINNYKRNEIKQRLQEIEERDLSEPEVKKAALQEATRLNKMLDQLDKQVRITFPQWKVTG